MEAPTLESIAKVFGVSHMTVSRALRGHENVRPETAERIRKYAEKIGYKPNSIARSLARSVGREMHLATSRSILVPYYEVTFEKKRNPLFWDYIEGAVQEAARTQSSIEVIGFSREESEFDFIRALVESGRIAGILDLGLSPKVIDYLISRDVPVVSRLQSVHDIGSRKNACLYPDHIQGYVMGWRYLLSLGHTRIGFIGREDHRPRLRECLAASQLLAESPNLTGTVWLGRHPTPEEITQSLLSAFGPWSREQWPTVFFCSNDDVAHQTILGITEMKLSVPRDISIFGFDNSPAAEFCNPPISTLHNPRKELGAAMLRLLKEIIAGRPDSRERVEILPMRLIERKSVARLK